MNITRHITVFCLVFLMNMMSGAGTAQTVDAAKLDALLAKMAAYDWGASREPLTQWAALEQSAYQDPAAVKLLEKKLLTLLTTGTPLAAKQFVCQRLSIIGSEASAPTLAKMLRDDQTADMARYALERIPGPAVDQALEKALTKSTGLTKIGIINTLGQRADAKAAPALIKLLSATDPVIVTAAAAALGKIGDTASSQALEKAIPNMKADVLATGLDAYLKCADKMALSGKSTEALLIYQKLQNSVYPDPVRRAALAGQVLTDIPNAAVILLKNIKSADPSQKSMAITLLSGLAAGEKMTAFAEELKQLPAELQVQLLSALADRGDRSVMKSVLVATDDENQAVRIAAFKALGLLGDASAIPVLVQAAASKTDEEKKAAQASLYRLNAENVDNDIQRKIATSPTAEKVELITAVGERNITDATALLLVTSQDANASVRLASIRVLGQIAAADDMPALIDLLLKTKSEAEQNEAVTALTAVSQKIGDPEKRAELVLAKLGQVKEESGKIALLRVLGRIGAAPGLPVLRAALKDKSGEIQVAAIRALSDWPGTEPITDLQTLAEKSTKPRDQVLALRGFIRLIKNDPQRPEAQTVALYQQALNLAKEDGEKKSVLSGLAELNSMAALETALGCLNQGELQDEVGAAVLKLGRRLWGDHPQPVKSAVDRVLMVITNPQLVEDLTSLKSRIK